MANASGDVKMSVISQRTGGRLRAWNQVLMEPLITLTQSSLIYVASIDSICFKLVSGMVAMDGIRFGDESIIRTGED